MKAVQINSYGGVEVLGVAENVSPPLPTSDHVVVDVHAASLNPFDWVVIQGFAQTFIPLQLPATMGGDFAGIVSAVGPSVSGFSVGDAVYGQAALFHGGTGVFAEQVSADMHKIAPKPKTINFIQAASLPLVSLSALQALNTHIKLVKGQKILIHGGAGGIGTIAIQLAKTIGARVITTVRDDDVEYVRGLGADEVIDYTSQSFESLISGVDAVFDTVGGETTDKSFQVLKKGGVLVSMAGAPNAELAKKYGVTAIGQNTQGNSDMLRQITDLVENGKIKPQVDKVFPLNQVKEAFAHLTTGHPRGKVVLQIKD